jgi:hypothetical protein
MRNSGVIALFLAIAVGAEPAIADAISNDSFAAGSLYAACTHSAKDAVTKQDHDTLEQICTLYLRGVTDALFVTQSIHNRGIPTCLPADQAVSVQDARVSFEAYLTKRPQDASNSAGLIATMAIVTAHACQSPN